MTSDIRLKMNRRYKLFKEAVSTKCPGKWSAYKKARNNVTLELRKAKTAYFSKTFGEVQSTSAYWNLMKRATDPKARKTIGPVKRDDGTLALADQEKACIMNSYFTTVGLNLASNFPPITGKRQGANSSPKDNRTVPLLKEVHVSGLAIRNKLEALNASKSMGLDNIQLSLLNSQEALSFPPWKVYIDIAYKPKLPLLVGKQKKLPQFSKRTTKRIGATIDRSPC